MVHIYKVRYFWAISNELKVFDEHFSSWIRNFVNFIVSKISEVFFWVIIVNWVWNFQVEIYGSPPRMQTESRIHNMQNLWILLTEVNSILLYYISFSRLHHSQKIQEHFIRVSIPHAGWSFIWYGPYPFITLSV